MKQSIVIFGLLGLFITLLLSPLEKHPPPLDIPTWVVVRTNEAFGVVYDVIHSAYDSDYELRYPIPGVNRTFLFIVRRECARNRRVERTTISDYRCRAKFYENYTLAKGTASLTAEMTYTDGHQESVNAIESLLLSYDGSVWGIDYHWTASSSVSLEQ